MIKNIDFKREFEEKATNTLIFLISKELEKDGLGLDFTLIENGLYENWTKDIGYKEFTDLSVRELALMAQKTYKKLLKEFQ